MGKNEIVSSEPAGNRYEVGPVITPISFSEQLSVVVHYRTFIVVVALTITALGALYAYAKPSTYEANLLIQVADMRSVEQKSLLGYASPGSGFKRAMSEVELLRSRAIVGAAVDKLDMDVTASARYFPLIGSAIARWNARREATVSRAWGGYAWNDETIRVGLLEVPEALLDTTFRITKTGPGRYRIEERKSRTISSGTIGQLHHMSVGQQVVSLRIDKLGGAPDTTYALARRPRVAAIDDITSGLQVSELGKDTGIIKVSLQHTDARRAQAFLNELGNTYMNFVREQKGKETNESLTILRAQLPMLKKRVELAEGRYETYRRNERAADLAEDTKLQLARYSGTKTRLSELRQKRAELGVRLGDAHPELVALDRQIAGLGQEAGAVAGDMQRVPRVATELERRARELKSETDIYGSVLRRVEEMSVDAQDRSTNVRIVDEAVIPVQPAESRLAVIAFAAALGIGIGTAGAFARKMRAGMRRQSLYDPEEMESERPVHYAHAG